MTCYALCSGLTTSANTPTRLGQLEVSQPILTYSNLIQPAQPTNPKTYMHLLMIRTIYNLLQPVLTSSDLCNLLTSKTYVIPSPPPVCFRLL